MTARTPSHPTHPARHIGHATPGSAVSGPLPTPADREWPTGTQVWNRAESAVLFGYGPAASNFL
ncbi:hypothetical protein [Streptomyces sp. NK08204]|uniref:hypothetical protein n=1 Tax=Streptomyces sp. NK08204 TaxID=2873260 RepID=UPI001CED8B69|nr:hypothetical protein [Streptomyces sp. NK08204]